MPRAPPVINAVRPVKASGGTAICLMRSEARLFRCRLPKTGLCNAVEADPSQKVRTTAPPQAGRPPTSAQALFEIAGVGPQPRQGTPKSPRPGAASLPTLAQDAVVTEDGPHPVGELEPSPPGRSIVVLAGGATRVPQAAVTSGVQRTVMVTRRTPLRRSRVADLGWGRGPKLPGMQGVMSAACQSARACWRGRSRQNSLPSGSRSTCHRPPA
jgi:hypothetical protein